MRTIIAACVLLVAVSACKKDNPTPAPTIGQHTQGGVIFYIDDSGQHGLVSATTDQSTGTWLSDWYQNVPETSKAIGSGKHNTELMLGYDNLGRYAVGLCHGLTLGGYSDWFLPSYDELYQMYVHREQIGNFSAESYWSSSVIQDQKACVIYFGTGNGGLDAVIGTHRVRAVRAF